MLVTVNINPGFITGQYKHHKDIHNIYNGDKLYIELPHNIIELGREILFNKELHTLKRKDKIIYYANSRSFLGIMRDLFVITLLKRKNDSVILHNHGSDQLYFSKFSLTNVMYNFLVAKAALVIFLNSYSVPRHNFLSKSIESKAKVLQNYCPEFTPKVSCDKSKTILFVSNFIPDKGYMRLINFASENEAKLRALGWQIKMIGNFVDVKQELSLKSFNSDILSIIGPLTPEQVSSELRHAKIFVFPSAYKTECQPLVVLEAVAHGCVVFSTEINNFLEGFGCLGVQSFKSSDKLFSQLLVALESNVILPRDGYDLVAASNKFSKEAFLSKFSDFLEDAGI